MIVNATRKLSSLVKRTKHGDDRNAFPRNGFAMVIRIVLTELTRTQLCTTVQHHSLALTINSLVRTVDALTKDGLVIMIMIVAMDLMKESSVTLNTKLVR